MPSRRIPWFRLGVLLGALFLIVGSLGPLFLLRLELARAHREGLVTSFEQVPSLLRIPPGENAGPLYKKAADLHLRLRNLTADNALTSRCIDGTCTPADRSEVRAMAVKLREPLELQAQASRLPACDFDRPWEMGAAILFPEYAQMMALSRFRIAAASIDLREGHRAKAFDEIEVVARTSSHLRQEPTLISYFVANRIEDLALLGLEKNLSAIRKTDHPRVQKVLDSFGERTDIRYALMTELATAVDGIDAMKSEKRRADLGLKEGDFGFIERWRATRFVSTINKRAFVREWRRIWPQLPKDNDYGEAEKVLARHEGELERLFSRSNTVLAAQGSAELSGFVRQTIELEARRAGLRTRLASMATRR